LKHINELILRETHDFAYLIHPGSTKCNQDLKTKYWWYNMKCDVVEYVILCDACQRVKAEHQEPYGLLEPLKIPIMKMGRDGNGLHNGITSNPGCI
jgi:hypothetical protein